MSKVKVYISGAITGHPLDTVRARFEAAKQRLLKSGYEVISPLENGLPPDAPWEKHMSRDLDMMVQCDVIYMLDGWEKSRGCQIEFRTAVELRSTIIFEQERNEDKGLHQAAEGNTGGKLVL